MRQQRKRKSSDTAYSLGEQRARDTAGDSAKPARSTKRTHSPARGAGDTLRMAAVAAALTANSDHPTSQAALAAARAVLGAPIHHSTLSRWVHEYSDRALVAMPNGPTDKDIVLASRNETLEQLSKARHLYLEHLVEADVVKESRARDAAVVVGITSDHINKATGLSTEYTSRLERIVKHAELLGMDAGQALDDFDSILASQLTTIADVLTRPALPAAQASDSGTTG